MAKENKKEELQEESQARLNFKKIIEAYKLKNPVKYELKKEELERKLSLIQ